MDLIELCEKEPSLENLLGSFNNQNVSDYLVVYLRLLTSGYLQREHIFFQHFIEGGRSVKEFCQQVGIQILQQNNCYNIWQKFDKLSSALENPEIKLP